MRGLQSDTMQHDFWHYVKPQARVSVWMNRGQSMIPAVVVRLNPKSVIIRLCSGAIKRVLRAAIADRAPGERSRQAER
jgi:hypothetical protein